MIPFRKRILMTGCNSFIGRHIKTLLESFGNQIICKTHQDSFDRSINEFDYIIHIGNLCDNTAINTLRFRVALYNTEYTWRIVSRIDDSFKGLFIYFSSVGVEHIRYEPIPQKYYSFGKLVDEIRIRSIIKKYSILRLPRIYTRNLEGKAESALYKIKHGKIVPDCWLKRIEVCYMDDFLDQFSTKAFRQGIHRIKGEFKTIAEYINESYMFDTS